MQRIKFTTSDRPHEEQSANLTDERFDYFERFQAGGSGPAVTATDDAGHTIEIKPWTVTSWRRG